MIVLLVFAGVAAGCLLLLIGGILAEATTPISEEVPDIGSLHPCTIGAEYPYEYMWVRGYEPDAPWERSGYHIVFLPRNIVGFRVRS